ncbi:hypothetical protein HHI36_005127, partial [Cryptolaemus montrouzieri]
LTSRTDMLDKKLKCQAMFIVALATGNISDTYVYHVAELVKMEERTVLPQAIQIGQLKYIRLETGNLVFTKM